MSRHGRDTYLNFAILSGTILRSGSFEEIRTLSINFHSEYQKKLGVK